MTGEFVAAEAAVRGLSWGLASKGAMAGPAVFLADLRGKVSIKNFCLTTPKELQPVAVG